MWQCICVNGSLNDVNGSAVMLKEQVEQVHHAVLCRLQQAMQQNEQVQCCVRNMCSFQKLLALFLYILFLITLLFLILLYFFHLFTRWDAFIERLKHIYAYLNC